VSTNNQLPYEVIPAEQNPLAQLFGSLCVKIEQNTYNIMDRLAGEHYKGGRWEFRKYANGAICMVFPDSTVIKPNTFNGYEVECSLEATSYAAWIINLSIASMAISANSSPESKAMTALLHDLHHGLMDAITGRIRFVITPGEGEGYRDLTPDEEDLLNGGKLQKHPEAGSIVTIID